MIVGLTGSICSGKETLARYLEEKYGFECINILELFRTKIELMVKEGKLRKIPKVDRNL
jgi:dephospho-CoA kinase